MSRKQKRNVLEVANDVAWGVVFAVFVKRGNPREDGIGERKGKTRQHNINERRMLHKPNTKEGRSKTSIKDRARFARNGSTSQLGGSLPDNLGEVRRLIGE